MKNCIILGSGRSGTSMVAGTLAKSGYFMGENLLPPRHSNPKGFFEDPFINGINEEILSNVEFGLIDKINRALSGRHFTDGQRWLENLTKSARLRLSKNVEAQILKAVSNSPFCYKDPRFSYTLPLWQPFLEDTVFICVFREPSLTAQSIVKECTDMQYLHSVDMSFAYALEVWYNVYSSILRQYMKHGEWLFIHYNQIFDVEGISKIESITNAVADKSFPDSVLKRTTAQISIDNKYRKLYSKLCELAGYKP